MPMFGASRGDLYHWLEDDSTKKLDKELERLAEKMDISDYKIDLIAERGFDDGVVLDFIRTNGVDLVVLGKGNVNNLIGSFTASIASTLTITGLQTDIKNAEDIRLVENISSVGATNGEFYLLQENIPISKTYASPIIALRALARKENDVLLYDHTILQYYINRLSLDEKVKLLPLTLKENYQSFMLPKNHPNFDLINVGLMKEIQKESWGDLQRKYDVKGK